MSLLRSCLRKSIAFITSVDELDEAEADWGEEVGEEAGGGCDFARNLWFVQFFPCEIRSAIMY